MNINKITTDVEDNKVSNRYQAAKTDYRNILASIFGIAALVIIWLFLWLVYRGDCYLNYNCVTTTYMFNGYSILLLVSAVIGLAFAIAKAYQSIKNSAFIRGMSMPVHRDDIRRNVDKAYAVDMELARSEMYRGLDALTTSNNSNSTTMQPLNDIANDSIDLDVIPFAELLKKK